MGDERHARLRDALLAWFARQGRDLPWRRTRDPYAVLVSEAMLQQTQVARVVPRYEAFLARFPTSPRLAGAATADVLVAWQGLGYNRRALNLQRSARVVEREHGGVVPVEVGVLETLPGVGPYTARAVAVFAADADVAPVDVNVARVLARAFEGRPLTRGEAQGLGDRLVPRGRGATFAGALMDLGATVCTARTPRCDRCPLRVDCAWLRVGGADPAALNALRARPQGTFVGSDRYHRGRLLDALRRGPIMQPDLEQATGLADAERLGRVVGGLVRDGLARWCGGRLALPHDVTEDG